VTVEVVADYERRGAHVSGEAGRWVMMLFVFDDETTGRSG
jgi:hypothetical protein